MVGGPVKGRLAVGAGYGRTFVRWQGVITDLFDPSADGIRWGVLTSLGDRKVSGSPNRPSVMAGLRQAR